MIYLSITALIIASLASISTFIVSKKPELKDQMENLTEYSGYSGVVLLIIGLLSFFGVAFIEIAWWDLFSFPGGGLAKLTLILFAPVAIILGFIQGYALIDKYVLNKAKEKGNAGEKFDKAGDQAYEKLAKYSVPFGFAGVVVALLLLLFELGILKP